MASKRRVQIKGIVHFLLMSLLLLSGSAQADFTDLQLNSSNDFSAGYGYSDTIGGNFISNAYLSQNNGVSFLNTGDGPTTAIHLPTSTVGTFTYQFYYINAFANVLTLQLWSANRNSFQPDIVVSTWRDSAPGAFLPIFDPSTAPPFEYPNGTPPGSIQAKIGGYIITLTGFSFTNGSGPATAYSVTPGASISPEIFGQFTYVVEINPELLKYQLNVNKTGTGTGTITSNPSGISCGGDCLESYNFGSSVALTALPDLKSVFSGWQGDCSGKSPCTLTMTGDKTATAVFTSKLVFLPIILRNDYKKPPGTPPTLINATVSPNSGPAGGTISVYIQFTFTDPDGDLDNGSLNFLSLSGQPVTIPLGSSFAGLKSGTGGGTLSLTLENQKGTFNIPCWLVDKAGNKSNFFYVQWTQY